jgi:hypothetical protein
MGAAATGLERAAPSRHLRSTCECYNVDDPSAFSEAHAVVWRKCERLMFYVTASAA